MNITYITLVKAIENFASNHLQVKRFHSDFADQIGSFSTEGSSFPILYAAPNTVTFNGEIGSDYTTIEMSFYCFDLIQESRENINFILNNTLLILNDLHLYFKNADIPGIELINATNVQPINNALLDSAAGWQTSMTFDIDVHSYCDIPFKPTGETFYIITELLENIVTENGDKLVWK